MHNVKDIVTDEEIKPVWEQLHYGDGAEPREILKKLLLKIACGYWIGSGSQFFTNELGLMYRTKKNRVMKLTDKGREYLYAAFE